MLEGTKVNLKVVEKDEVGQFLELSNRPELWGLYESPNQRSKEETQRNFEEWRGSKRFFIQTKAGANIGIIIQFEVVPGMAPQFGLEIGYAMAPEERGKGYTTDAVNLLLDYSFLTSPVTRIQAHVEVENLASQRILEKTGFTREGINRKSYFANGALHDMVVFSLLRDDWKEPRVLKVPG
ncbi:MAG TPA: GNAT family protein [Nitrososphaerales archaeon]|nr:GNAT family protein [Nitrososphaerales archaeon]